ncbi:MAG: hypothetical protein M3044_03665 [Thermoproteota archaeon]|nr:hypothetical protein [Thermoproteota archaeon]
MNTRKYNHRTRAIIGGAIIAISLLSAAILLSCNIASRQMLRIRKLISHNRSQIRQSANTAAPPIGNVQQLSKALGNNSKILANNFTLYLVLSFRLSFSFFCTLYMLHFHM